MIERESDTPIESHNRTELIKGRDGALRFNCCECHPFAATERATGWRRVRHEAKIAAHETTRTLNHD